MTIKKSILLTLISTLNYGITSPSTRMPKRCPSNPLPTIIKPQNTTLDTQRHLTHIKLNVKEVTPVP